MEKKPYFEIYPNKKVNVSCFYEWEEEKMMEAIVEFLNSNQRKK